MEEERKHKKKPRITFGDLIVRKDPKGGFGHVSQKTETGEKHIPPPPAGEETPGPAPRN